MAKLNIPHRTLVIVGDGRKALFLRNAGDETYPDLRVVKTFEEDHPQTAALGTDRPGRVAQSVGRERSAVEQTDWHTLAEEQFARRIAHAASEIDAEEPIAALIVVAPPRTLAQLRVSMSPSVKRHVIAEIAKDLTRHPVADIERSLTAS